LGKTGETAMKPNPRITICLAAALASTACSTKPRTFSATVQPATGLAAAPANQAEVFSTCDRLVRAGHKSEFAAVAASGAATGATLVGGAGAIAASGTIGIGATAAGTVMMAALPFVGIAAGFGVNRMIRSGRERKYKRIMATCMGELGYEVVDWTRAAKRQPGTAVLSEPMQDAAVLEVPELADRALGGPVSTGPVPGEAIPAVIVEEPQAGPNDQIAVVQ